MKIKQTTFYALRIIYRIHREESGVTTSKEIAEKEEVSQGVTLRILRRLAQARILCAHQGRGQVCGGFSLVRGIDEITMLEVVNVLEGIDIGKNLDEVSRNQETCLFRVCNRLNQNLKERFSEYTIRNLFEGMGESAD